MKTTKNEQYLKIIYTLPHNQHNHWHRTKQNLFEYKSLN